MVPYCIILLVRANTKQKFLTLVRGEFTAVKIIMEKVNSRENS